MLPVVSNGDEEQNRPDETMMNLQNEQVVGKRASSRAKFLKVPRRVAYGGAAAPVKKFEKIA